MPIMHAQQAILAPPPLHTAHQFLLHPTLLMPAPKAPQVLKAPQVIAITITM